MITAAIRAPRTFVSLSGLYRTGHLRNSAAISATSKPVENTIDFPASTTADATEPADCPCRLRSRTAITNVAAVARVVASATVSAGATVKKRSSQINRNRGVSAPLRSTSQLTVTTPVGEDHAPYLPELVASWRKATPIACDAPLLETSRWTRSSLQASPNSPNAAARQATQRPSGTRNARASILRRGFPVNGDHRFWWMQITGSHALSYPPGTFRYCRTPLLRASPLPRPPASAITPAHPLRLEA